MLLCFLADVVELSEEEFEWHEVKSEYKKKEEEANDDVQRKMYVSTGMHEKSTMGVKLLKIKGWLIEFGIKKLNFENILFISKNYKK